MIGATNLLPRVERLDTKDEPAAVDLGQLGQRADGGADRRGGVVLEGHARADGGGPLWERVRDGVQRCRLDQPHEQRRTVDIHRGAEAHRAVLRAGGI